MGCVDFYFDPVVQSGGNYDLEARASNHSELAYDCILMRIAVSYCQYNCCIARSIFIDPTDVRKNIFFFFLGDRFQLLLFTYNILVQNILNFIIKKKNYNQNTKNIYEKANSLMIKLIEWMEVGVNLSEVYRKAR